MYCILGNFLARCHNSVKVFFVGEQFQLVLYRVFFVEKHSNTEYREKHDELQEKYFISQFSKNKFLHAKYLKFSTHKISGKTISEPGKNQGNWFGEWEPCKCVCLYWCTISTVSTVCARMLPWFEADDLGGRS